MNIHQPIDLKSRLLAAADAWTAAHAAPRSRLGKRVAGDAAFFDRIAPVEPLACNVATLEKFARFLADQENWPEGCAIPQEVVAFGHAVGVTAAPATASIGQAGEMSGQRSAA